MRVGGLLMQIRALVIIKLILRRLHNARNADSHGRQHSDQLAANDGGRCQEELFSLFIGFRQDGMTVIKSVEKLGQLERMLREISRLGGRNALAHKVGGLGGGKPELPNFVAVGTIEILSKILGRDGACPVSGAVGDVAAIGDAASRVSTKCLRIKSTLAEDVRRAHDRVLYVRTGLSL